MSDNKASKYGVVEGTLVYAKIAQPDYKYQSKDKEFSIGIVVDEDTADDWEEKFKKQPAKKFKAADFEKKFKMECPIEGAKNVYVITLKKDADTQFPPKVLLDKKDGERVDITESRLIANGSVGKVSYFISSNDFGTFARLNNVLMDEDGFKEYVSTGGSGSVGKEFGDSKPVTKEAARKEATEARPDKNAEKEAPAKEAKKESPKKAAKPVDDDSDVPF